MSREQTSRTSGGCRRHDWTTIPEDVLKRLFKAGMARPGLYVGRHTDPYCTRCGIAQADAPPKPKRRCRWFGHDFGVRGMGVPVFCWRCGISRVAVLGALRDEQPDFILRGGVR